MLKDYLPSKNARLERNRLQLLERAKCYSVQEPEDPSIISQFTKHQDELFENRKIFEAAKSHQWKGIYTFDLSFPKTFNEVLVNTYLTHQLVEINGELVDIGIEKPVTKGKNMYALYLPLW